MIKDGITSKKILLIVFAVIIGLGLVLNASNLHKSFRHAGDKSSEEIEACYNEQLFMRKELININGLVRKGLNQKIVNGVIKAEDGQLFLIEDTEYVFNKEKETKYVRKALNILGAAEESGSDVLYVQHPNKYKEETTLPYGMECQINEQYDFWLKCMKDNDVPTLDLRRDENCTHFYNTDHHWNCESSYASAKEIVKALNAINAADVSILKNNKVINYPKAFLGSEGVRTGEFYDGKDDFNIIVPRTESIFHLKHLVDGKIVLSKDGKFEKAFLDEAILNDAEYYNKYNAFLYGGYVENRIINDDCNNNSKLLLISDSFSRSMVIYLCQAFHETRYLDPQQDRYNDSFVEYIEDYEPDVVVLMYTGDFVKE